MRQTAHILYLLAAVQGIFLAAVLSTRKQHRDANTILAIATLCLSLDLLSAYYYSTGLYRSYPHFMGVTYPFPLMYGPLFYLYAKLVSKKTSRLQWTDWLHFVPATAAYVLCFPLLLYSGAQKIDFMNQMTRGVHPPLFATLDYVLPVQGILYATFTISIVRDYNKRIREAFSNIDVINLNWLKFVTVLGLLIWTIVAILLFIRPLTMQFEGSVQVFMAILIYSIGYKGLKQPEIFLDSPARGIEAPQAEKYKRSGLNDVLASRIHEKLIAHMASEKPYLDDGLTLHKLAEQLEVSSHNLSEVINSTMHLCYYDFINAHRVEEFKKRIADPANNRFTILSVALDSGFPSKGSFNSIFKKSTGMTPSEFKDRVRRTVAVSPVPGPAD